MFILESNISGKEIFELYLKNHNKNSVLCFYGSPPTFLMYLMYKMT